MNVRNVGDEMLEIGRSLNYALPDRLTKLPDSRQAGGPETVSVHFLLEPWRTEGAPGSFFEPGSWAFIFLHFCIYSLLP
jgi:hypothetical protein